VAPLPFTHTGAGIPFYGVLFVFALLEQRVRARSWRNRGQGTREDHGSLFVVMVAISAGIAGGLALASGVHGATISVARWPVFAFGVALMATGVVLRQWSVTLLGEHFTVDVRVHPDQEVVDAGPYRFVRHPSYTGLLLTLAGMGLALGNWAGLAALIVFPAAGVVFRIHAEERALLAGIGEPYRRFAAGRARLVPGVW
jgi:protein-S-isoprenylcysteine O-methyltransferase Ste14